MSHAIGQQMQHTKTATIRGNSSRTIRPVVAKVIQNVVDYFS